MKAASARKRAEGLAPIVADAQRQADALRAEIGTHEAAAHAAYVAGDAGAGDAHQEKAASLRPLLGDLEAKVRTLEQAARELSQQQQREAMDVRLAAIRGDLAAALTEMRQCAAEVWPAMSAAKTALRQARAAEERVRRLEGEQWQLEASLDGRVHPGRHPATSDVRSMIEASRLLTNLLASDEA